MTKNSQKQNYFFQKAILVCLAGSMNGCTTMNAISDSAKSFGKGDVGDGIMGSIYALSVAPLTDIVTLGGSMSAEEGAAAWAGAANEYAKTNATTTSNRASQTSGASISSEQQLAMATAALATALEGTSNQSSADNTSEKRTSAKSRSATKYVLPTLNALPDNKDLVNTPDGFEFRVYEKTKWYTDHPSYEAVGGPCTAVGIIGLNGRLDEVLSALRPNYKINHYLSAFSEPSYLNGHRVDHFISKNVNYALTTQENRRKYEYAKSNKVKKDELEVLRDGYETAQCLERNHMQYVIAFENWAKRNEKPLMKIVKQHWGD